MPEFKTLQFPNTPRGQADKVQALQRETSQGWSVVSETIVAGKFKGGQACCLFLIFAPCAFLAGHQDDIITVTLQRESAGQPATGTRALNYDRTKWTALLQYDSDIANAANQLRPLDPKWTDELAAAYLVLNDKAYLPQILSKISDRVRAEQEEKIALRARGEARRKELELERQNVLKAEAEQRERIVRAFWGTTERKILTVAAIVFFVLLVIWTGRALVKTGEQDSVSLPADRTEIYVTELRRDFDGRGQAARDVSAALNIFERGGVVEPSMS